MQKPLEGLLVIELATYWVGPSAGAYLRSQGARVIKVNIINPLPVSRIAQLCAPCRAALVAEDVCAHGSVGEELRGELAQPVKLLNLGHGVVTHGSVRELLHSLCLDGEGIAAAAETLLSEVPDGKDET